MLDGTDVGKAEGVKVGAFVGFCDSAIVGSSDGKSVGIDVGTTEGAGVGPSEGFCECVIVGNSDGA
jgi:hypothetical protein